MKYLKVTSVSVFQTNEISKRDLIDIKEKFLDWLIDMTNGTYFDPEKNKWVKIQNV